MDSARAVVDAIDHVCRAMDFRPRPHRRRGRALHRLVRPAGGAAGRAAFITGQSPIRAGAAVPGRGTLWAEQPLYFRFLDVLDKAKALAAVDPAWAATPVLNAAAPGLPPRIARMRVLRGAIGGGAGRKSTAVGDRRL